MIRKTLCFAPGVIEGPYRRETLVAVLVRKVIEAAEQVADYLMGPTP